MFLLQAIVGFTMLFSTNCVDWNVETVLDEYVNRDDGYFSYDVIEVYDQPDYVMHVINMTSQKWMDEGFSSQSIWWHYLSIFIPKNLVYRENALLFIGNGGMSDMPPTPGSNSQIRRAASMAVNLGAVTANLRQVPNQEIYFVDNPSLGRVEDLIIGYTWKKYVENPELGTDVILQLPMTKAAKKALDVMVDYCAKVDSSISLQRFLPFGYSKRGWVTWLLGAVDRRVFAMVPAVFDLLSMLENLDHHYRSLNGWSWAFLPYWAEGVSRYFRHPRIKELTTIIDPFSYNERLTMPKMVAIGTGDQFFPPTGSNYFFDLLTEPKYKQVFENDDHALGRHTDVLDQNIESLFVATSQGRSLPDFTWVRNETETGGSIVVYSPVPPLNINAWWADTTEVVCEEFEEGNICRRDFRENTRTADTGIIWRKDPVINLGGGSYKVEYTKRTEDGYRGFFIEATYPGPAGYTHRVTTEIQVIPDILPFPPCVTEEQCLGRIV